MTLSFFTTDATSLLVSGKPIGFTKANADVRGLLHHKRASFRWINFLATEEGFSWYIRNTWIGRRFLMPRPTDKSGIGIVMSERDRIVGEVVDDGGNINKSALVKGSLLNSLLTAWSAGSSVMTITDIKAEILFAV
jgi:hypothetical protein